MPAPSKKAAAPQRTSSGQKPAAKFRMGRIAATVWRNEGEKGAWFTTTILRSYKDGDQWKTSSSFGRDDLPLVEKVAVLAHAWIYHHQQRQEGYQQGGEPQDDGTPPTGNEDIPF